MKIIILYIFLTACITASIGYTLFYQFHAPSNWRAEHTYTFDECVGNSAIGWGMGLSEGGVMLRIHPRETDGPRYTMDFGEVHPDGELVEGSEALARAGIFPGANWDEHEKWLIKHEPGYRHNAEMHAVELLCPYYVANYHGRHGRYRFAQAVFIVSFIAFCAVPFILHYRRRNRGGTEKE